jgi:SAM-dependent methyltransferase
MVEAARGRGIDARVCDAAQLPVHRRFDSVFSNAALHWMKTDPNAVIGGVARALKPGGRFAGEMGGHGCVAAITVALLAELEHRGIANPASAIPWYFPTVDDYRARLERAGLAAEYIALIPRPTPLPTHMRGWLETFAIPFTARIVEPERGEFLDAVVERLRPVLCDEQDRWTADYMRLDSWHESPNKELQSGRKDHRSHAIPPPYRANRGDNFRRHASTGTHRTVPQGHSICAAARKNANRQESIPDKWGRK